MRNYGSAHASKQALRIPISQQESDLFSQKLAPKYFTTRFFRVFVENIPWLVEKLGIKVLPCVIIFVKGMAKDRSVPLIRL